MIKSPHLPLILANAGIHGAISFGSVMVPNSQPKHHGSPIRSGMSGMVKVESQ